MPIHQPHLPPRGRTDDSAFLFGTLFISGMVLLISIIGSPIGVALLIAAHLSRHSRAYTYCVTTAILGILPGIVLPAWIILDFHPGLEGWVLLVGVTVSYLALTVGSLIILLDTDIRAAFRRRRWPTRCGYCGYELLVQSIRCPECGRRYLANPAHHARYSLTDSTPPTHPE